MRLRASSWTLLAVWALAVIRPEALVHTISGPFLGWPAADWSVYVDAARQGWVPEVYREPAGLTACDVCYYRYSPAALPLFALLAPAGQTAWQLLHLAVLPLLGWELAVAVLLSWTFWADVATGNTVTFVLIAAVSAIRGSQAGTAMYFTLGFLIPRPFMLPLMAWLLWKRPESRPIFLVLFVAHGLVVAASGLGPDWVAALAHELAQPELFNVAPSYWIGSLWLPLGIVLGIGLWRMGYPGLAGLAISPFLLPFHMLFAFTFPDEHRRRPAGLGWRGGVRLPLHSR